MSSKHGQGTDRKCLLCSQKEGQDIIVSGKSVSWHLKKKHKGLRISDAEFEVIGKINLVKDVGATMPQDQHTNFSQSTRSKSIQKHISNGIFQPEDQIEGGQLISNTAEPMLNKFENLLGKLDDISQPSSSNNSATKLLIDELKEHMKQQLQDKDKTILELKQRVSKLEGKLKSQKGKSLQRISLLEEKLESKDNELMQLRVDLSATNILQKQLKEKEDEIKKLNAELIQVNKDSLINLHSQCEETTRLLKAQVESLTIERDKYRDHRDELAKTLGKKVREAMDEHMNESKDNQTSQDEKSETEIEQVEGNSEYAAQESDEDSIPQIGINCKLNSNNLNDKIRAQQHTETHNNNNNMTDTKRSQATSDIGVGIYKSEGYMQWNDDNELIGVAESVQQNNLAKIKMATFRYRCFTCEQLFFCEVGWRKHQEWMALNGRTCKCDVFQYGKYYHTIGINAPYKRTMDKKELKKLEALISTTIINPELIQPQIRKTELETRRDIQRNDSLEFIKTCKSQLAVAENWLLLLSQQCSKAQLKALDDPICDAIIYPRCPLLFGENVAEHDRKLKVFLIDHDIPVRLITDVATNNKAIAFICLMDSDNKFSPELINKLNQSLEELGNQIRVKIQPSELQQQRIEAQLNNLYIRQIDYTKDFLGFLMVLSLLDHRPEHIFDILRELGRMIRMEFSANHSQLLTSIQFESFITDLISGKPVRSERLKIYNKLVQLLTITSIKAKLSMGTSKLFKASLAFHQKKILPSFNDGLTRIELSSYFNSVREWKDKAFNVDSWERRIKSIQDALHNVSEQLIYKVNFKVFWDSFWLTVDNATTIIVFEPDLWTVAYAYSYRSYLFTGHYTDKHNKSGAKLTFLQRFAGKKTLVRVSNGKESKEFLIYRYGESRQIPIESLNVIQYEEYRFPIDLNKWFYNLSKEQLDIIYFTCANQEEFDEWFGQDPALARPYMNQIDQRMYDVEQQPERSTFQEDENCVINTSS